MLLSAITALVVCILSANTELTFFCPFPLVCVQDLISSTHIYRQTAETKWERWCKKGERRKKNKTQMMIRKTQREEKRGRRKIKQQSRDKNNKREEVINVKQSRVETRPKQINAGAQGNLPWVWVVSWVSAPACPWGSEVRTRGPGGSWKSRLPPAQSARHPWWSRSHQDCCPPPRSLCQIRPQRALDTPSRCCWQQCSSREAEIAQRKKKRVRKLERMEGIKNTVCSLGRKLNFLFF